jgi:hypothetical protein
LLANAESPAELGNGCAVSSDGLQREAMDGARSGMAGVSELVVELINDRSERADQQQR